MFRFASWCHIAPPSYTLENQPLLKTIKHVPIISKKLTIKKAISVHHVGAK